MIYFDHNATSPLLPEVRIAIEPWLGRPANPASIHGAGRAAAVAVEQAREHVAALIGGTPQGVVFTSGATEANHCFLRGAARLHPGSKAFISAIEHPSVHAAAQQAQVDSGVEVNTLTVNSDGVVRTPRSFSGQGVLSRMAANHETGVVQPVEAAAEGLLLHVDATQAAGRLPLNLGHIDGVVLSSHKIGGPGGMGALVFRGTDAFPALLSGGSQERGRRAGTVNVMGVVGFGEACRIALRDLDERTTLWLALRARIEAAVVTLGGRVIAADSDRLPQTVCAGFDGIPGETLVQHLDLSGIAVSSGAACSSGSLEPSAVLTAMQDPFPGCSVRFSMGPQTSDADVSALLDALAVGVPALRDIDFDDD